jgi:hypothetical protein
VGDNLRIARDEDQTGLSRGRIILLVLKDSKVTKLYSNSLR